MNPPPPDQRDDPRLDPFLAECNETANLNTAAYDKAILTLASAGLAISLTFTEYVVPIATAKLPRLLFASWLGFFLTLAVVISNFILSLFLSSNARKAGYDTFRHRKKTPAELTRIMERHLRWTNALNIAQGVVFLVAMGLFAAYIWANVEQQRHLKGGMPVSTSAAGTLSDPPSQVKGVTPGSGATREVYALFVTYCSSDQLTLAPAACGKAEPIERTEGIFQSSDECDARGKVLVKGRPSLPWRTSMYSCEPWKITPKGSPPDKGSPAGLFDHPSTAPKPSK